MSWSKRLRFRRKGTVSPIEMALHRKCRRCLLWLLSVPHGKGVATKYEELSAKHAELGQRCQLYRRNESNISEDYGRRMAELDTL